MRNPEESGTKRFASRAVGKLLLVAVMVCGLAVFAAACGGSSDDGTDTGAFSGASTEAASGGSDDLAAFEEKVDQIVADRSGKQTRTPPDTGPKAAKGKTVYIVACSQALEGCQRESVTAQEAGEAMGWNMTLFDTESKPDKMVEGIQRAIDNKADGIIVQAIDMNALAAPLEKAKAAGAFVVCFACVNHNDIASQVIPSEESFYEDGYDIAAQMYKNTEGSPRILVISNKETGVIVKRLEGTKQFVEDCKAAGGDCEIVNEEYFLYSNMTTAIPELVSVSLQQSPETNAVWMGFDSSSEFVEQGVNQAGKANGDLALYGFDGNKANIAAIRDGGLQVASMAGPFEWVGWAEVDALNRVFHNEEPVSEVVVSKLITQENAPANDIYDGEVDYKQAYLDVWGVK